MIPRLANKKVSVPKIARKRIALFNARNESVRQPHLNLQIAKAYLAGTDSGVSTRTWQHALEALIEAKHGSTQDRCRRAAKEAALDFIRDRVIIETQASICWRASRPAPSAPMSICGSCTISASP